MSKSLPKINVWKTIAYVLFGVLQSLIAVGVHDMRDSSSRANETADKATTSIALIQKTMFTKLEGASLHAKITTLERTTEFPPADWYEDIHRNSNRLTGIEAFIRSNNQDQTLFR